MGKRAGSGKNRRTDGACKLLFFPAYLYSIAGPSGGAPIACLSVVSSSKGVFASISLFFFNGVGLKRGRRAYLCITNYPDQSPEAVWLRKKVGSQVDFFEHTPCSSIGRAPRSHRGGCEFESHLRSHGVPTAFPRRSHGVPTAFPRRLAEGSGGLPADFHELSLRCETGTRYPLH